MSATIQLRTPDGTSDTYITHPAGEGPWPGVVMIMDGIGMRDSLRAMADRLASHGYYVALPNLYYRNGAFEPLDPKSLLDRSSAGFQRVMKMVTALDDASAMRDVGACFDYLASQPAVRGTTYGIHGYCMGGGIAIAAACYHPTRVAAAASFHGGRFLVEPASAELIAEKTRCPVYLGVADGDNQRLPDVMPRLQAALAKSGTPHEIELYSGAQHGWAVTDHPAYDAAAAERHWEKLLAFYAKSLR